MTTRERGGKHKTDLGYCDLDKREILLNPRQSRLEKERTYVHEVLHAAAGQAHGDLEAEAEEHTILRIEDALRDALVGGAFVVEEG